MVIQQKITLPNIRIVVKAIFVFVALILFQTSFLQLGTITMALSIAFLAVSFFFSRRTISLFKQKTSIVILSFLIVSVIVTVLYGRSVIKIIPFVGYVFVFLLTDSIMLSKKEAHFLSNGFSFAMVVYSLLIIYSCIVNVSLR